MQESYELIKKDQQLAKDGQPTNPTFGKLFNTLMRARRVVEAIVERASSTQEEAKQEADQPIEEIRVG